MKTPLVLGAWALTVVGAFFVGDAISGGDQESEGEAADPVEVARLETRVNELTEELHDAKSRRPRTPPAREEGAGVQPAVDVGEVPSDGGGHATDVPPAGPTTISLEGIDTPHEASELFMAFARSQLARGDDGYKAILDAMGQLWEDREGLKRLFGDETVAVRELYPWVRFLVQNEESVIDMSEFVFRNMAENPSMFESMPDDDVLEIFTEGVGFIIPGAISDERLARLRGYAEKIIETPEQDQPKAVRGNRRDIERLLARYWAAPMSVDEIVEKLRSGKVPPRELARLIRMVPSEAIADLDVTALVLPAIRKGDYYAIRVLGAVPADMLDIARLDQALLGGLDAGTAQAGALQNYFRLTSRQEWPVIRPFFDRAFSMGEKAQGAAALALSGYLPRRMRPDGAYVVDLLERGVVPEAWVQRLRGAYELK